MTEGILVRALRNFDSNVEGELPLTVGCIVQVHRKLDRYWLYGCKTDGRCGSFPASHVVDVNLPPFASDGKELIYVAKSNFGGQEAGDLPLKKGDIVVGETAVDVNWHRGRCEGQTGIFPLNLVWQADMELLLKTGQNKALRDAVVNLKAKVKMDLKAQLEEEMDLREGEVVTITEVVDKDWYRGTCNGKSGIFPSAFVKVLSASEVEQQVPDLLASVTESTTRNATCTKTNEPIGNGYSSKSSDGRPSSSSSSSADFIFSDSLPHAQTVYRFKGEFANELSFEAGRTVRLLRAVDAHWLEGELDGRVGLFPLCYVTVVVGLPKRVGEDAAAVADATILYDFQAQLDGDVSVTEGEKVKVIENLDSGWCRIMTSNGGVGLCPAAYVKQQTLATVREGGGNMQQHLGDVPMHRQMSLPTWPSSQTPERNAVRHQSVPPTSMDAQTVKQPNEARSHSMPPPRRPPPIRHSVADINQIAQGLSPSTTGSPRIPHRPAPPIPFQRARPHSVAAIWASSKHSVRPFSRNMSEADTRSSNSSESDTWLDATSTVSDEGVTLRQHHQSAAAATTTTTTARSNSPSPATVVQVTAASDDKAEKQARKRQLILAEMLQTEKTYLEDLQFCDKTFLADTEVAISKGIDMQLLFRFVDRLLALSEKLVGLLEQATAVERTAENLTVGTCFKQVAAEMKEVYSGYCTRHEEVLSLLDKYEENPEISGYFREKLESSPSPAHYFNMGSLLIKPVQRIMKYPLLLNELVKVTDDGDPARKDLVAAIELMTDVASAINECKRKKDLVMKYRKECDEGQAAKLTKLNLHSVVKKSQRIGMRLSSSLGLVSLTKDMSFDEEEAKFHAVERTSRQFSKNFETFCGNLQDYVTHQFKLAEHIGDMYAEQRNRSEVDKFRTVQRTIISSIWADFKSAVDKRVAEPLSQLLRTFDGPNRLIEKRNDKLLDYDRTSAKIEKNKDINRSGLLREELQLAKNTYEALNSQLLEELPKLTTLANLVLKDCIASFVFARKRFIGRVTQITLPLMELPLLASCSGDILDRFEEKHADVIDRLSTMALIPREFHHSPRPERSSGRFGTIERLRKSAGAGGGTKVAPTTPMASQADAERPPKQSSSQKAYLQGRYLPEMLHTVGQTYGAMDALELSLNAGDLVAVIKNQDPMGRTDRWFVDDGVRKGFVPAKFLVVTTRTPPTISPLQPTTDVTKTTAMPAYYDIACGDEIVCDQNGATGTHMVEDRYDLPCEMGDMDSEGTVSPDAMSLYDNLEMMTVGSGEQSRTHHISPVSSASEFFYATYEFRSTGPNELSLAQGQVVLVRHRRDLDGNSDWWFVEDRFGNQGYAPCNYLAPYTATVAGPSNLSG